MHTRIRNLRSMIFVTLGETLTYCWDCLAFETPLFYDPGSTAMLHDTQIMPRSTERISLITIHSEARYL